MLGDFNTNVQNMSDGSKQCFLPNGFNIAQIHARRERQIFINVHAHSSSGTPPVLPLDDTQVSLQVSEYDAELSSHVSVTPTIY